MKTKQRTLLLTSFVVIASSLAYPRTTLAESVQSIDERTRDIVTLMGEFLDDLPQFAFTAKVRYDRALEAGTLVEAHEVHHVAVKRPGQLRATVLGDSGLRAALISDGTATLVDPVSRRYFQCEVPKSVGGAVDVLVIDLGLSLPSADFIYEDSASTLLADVESSEYLGVVPIDGAPCHHMVFLQEGLEWQLWVSAGVHPVPNRISMRYTDRPGAPRFSASLDWNLATTRYSDSAFAFIVDDGMTVIESIEDFVKKGDGE